VDKYGLVDPEDVRRAITVETILITIMHANNEIGTIEPIVEIGEIAQERGIIFHTDAAQSCGKIKVDVNKLKVDLLTIAGHKTKPFDVSVMPRGTYTSPQVASFGLSEAKAQEQGLTVRVGKFPFLANGKALGIGDNAEIGDHTFFSKVQWVALQNVLTLIRERASRNDITLALKSSPEIGDFVADQRCEMVFENGRYAYNWPYSGFTELPKHFFPIIGDLKGEGEEFECALFLATQLNGIKYWLRNVERKPTSFSLQTSTDRFYPDFVCMLTDGRILVVEYKGSDKWDTPDSIEKRQIGGLWAKRSAGKGIFIMPKGKDLAAIKSIVEKKISTRVLKTARLELALTE